MLSKRSPALVCFCVAHLAVWFVFLILYSHLVRVVLDTLGTIELQKHFDKYLPDMITFVRKEPDLFLAGGGLFLTVYGFGIFRLRSHRRSGLYAVTLVLAPTLFFHPFVPNQFLDIWFGWVFVSLIVVWLHWNALFPLFAKTTIKPRKRLARNKTKDDGSPDATNTLLFE